MVVEIFIVAIAFAFSILMTYYVVPTGFGYHYFAPILLLIAGYIVGIVLAWCILFLFSIMVNQKKEYKKPNKWAAFWLRDAITYINHHAGVKLNIVYKADIPHEKYLLVCNHRSKFDPMILAEKFAGEELAFISKPSNFKIPIGHRFMVGACYLAVDRQDKLQSLEVMKKASELIASDSTSVGVFPEGTRSDSLEMGPFHEGVFSIAKRSNCPIVISSFMGTENIHKNFPKRRTKITLQILEVLYPSDYKGMTSKAISDYCFEVMNRSLTDRIKGD